MTIIHSTNSHHTVASPSQHHDSTISPKSVVQKHIRTTKAKLRMQKQRDIATSILYEKYINETCKPFDDSVIQSSNSHRRYLRRGSRAPSMMFQLEVTAAAAACATALHEQTQQQHQQQQLVQHHDHPHQYDQHNQNSFENGKCEINFNRSRNDRESIVNRHKNKTDGQETFEVFKEHEDRLSHYHRKNNTSLMNLLGLQLQESVSFRATFADTRNKQNTITKK
jgi:hypothetical protein